MFLLTTFVSCKKMPQQVGESLQPNSNYIHVAFSGNQNIISEVSRVDSLSTRSASLSLVGDLNDPFFGNSNLSFYTQIGLTSSSLDWGEGAVTDSIVLQLLYSGYYGDTLTPLTIKVHEVTQDLGSDSLYYSNISFDLGEELANHTFTPKPKTKIEEENDTIGTAVLRIPIYNTFGDKLMTNDFTSNESFMDFLKGLYISCEPSAGTGSICYFNLLNTKSFMRIYYHNNNNDTTSYEFNISDKYVRFNHFEHDYNTAQSPISFNDTASNEYLFVQSTAGVRTRIEFPNLAQWAEDMNTNVLINEAKLTLTGANLINGVNNDTTIFTQPLQLVVVKANSDGSYSILPDQFVGTNYFGGYYEPETDQVWFRISEYVQDLILAGPNAEDYGLYIYTYSGAFNAKRWIFHGPDSHEIDKRIKLEIVYSKIDD